VHLLHEIINQNRPCTSRVITFQVFIYTPAES